MRLIPILMQAVVAAALLLNACSYVAEPPEDLEAVRVEPGSPAAALDRTAASGPIEAVIEDTFVYLEFPETGDLGNEYKRMDFSVRVRNTSERPVEVRVEDLYLSFDRGSVGRPLGEIEISTADAGRRIDDRRIAVPARDSTLVRIRGDRAFRDEEAGPTVYLTLVLRSGENTVAVRDETPMMIAR